MTTFSAGMRTVLATAAAGALVLGSAGAVTAKPDKAKGPKAKVVAAAEVKTKLTKVDIKRHKKINLAKVDLEAAEIKLRAKVRYSKKVASDAASVQAIPMTLAVYTKKVNGEMVEGTGSTATDLAIKERKKDKRSHRYYGSAKVTEVWSGDQLEALDAYVVANGKAFICISGVEGDFDKFTKQTRKRLAVKADGSDISRKPVRECVKVVKKAPKPEAKPAT